jgi:hypothetical protein
METMTINDVSRLLHITEDTARNRLSAGMDMPPSFKAGKRRLFLKTEVEVWMQKLSVSTDQKQKATELAYLNQPTEEIK